MARNTSGSSDTGNSAKWLHKALWMLLSRCTGIFEKKHIPCGYDFPLSMSVQKELT